MNGRKSRANIYEEALRASRNNVGEIQALKEEVRICRDDVSSVIEKVEQLIITAKGLENKVIDKYDINVTNITNITNIDKTEADIIPVQNYIKELVSSGYLSVGAHESLENDIIEIVQKYKYDATQRYLVSKISDLQKQISILQAQIDGKIEHIYFIIEEPFSNKVMIGKTRHAVDKRINELQSGNGNELVVFHKIECDVIDNVKGKLHKHYASRNIRGGWFKFTLEELKLVIESL